MRILIVLTYYRPHISGLTIYAERLAVAMVKRGHQVTVLTSQYDKNLPQAEIIDGVRIARVPVLFKLSKGVIMPGFGEIASQLLAKSDVVHLHLPQFDAAGIALRGKINRIPTVITYHCDLLMPAGLLNWLANAGVNIMNKVAGRATHRIVTYTQDYADHSKYLAKFVKKTVILPPPVVLPEVSQDEKDAFARTHNPENQRPVIGMVARFATEKGVEVLLNALPRILEVYPHALVEFVGPFGNILGEEKYYARLKPTIDRYIASGNWKFMGPLNPNEIAAYYPNLDVHVLPSLNSTEAFGLVQIEAMMNGVPCVTSNLPGVRQPVMVHGMGKIFPIGDADALAASVVDVLQNRAQYTQSSPDSFTRYTPDAIAAEYVDLFEKIQKELK